ncbi:hypothetical protein EYR41_002110 [Orbilia oligospora]|uniref:G5 domain-containing protein n=1 Tax=Orbilia oligospora TaxID=2813651 RepID=A0A8H2EBV8_ORBOL|nr:hypothetical protein EYR41_002110 [Orbilia oligospora]
MPSNSILLAATAILAVIPTALATQANVGLFTHFHCEKANVMQGVERCGGGVGNGHCAYVVQSTAGPFVLCNGCKFTPQQTAGCWPTYFTFPQPAPPPPPPPPPEVKTVTVAPPPPPEVKTVTITRTATGKTAITVYRTVLVGTLTKTILKGVYPLQTTTVKRFEYVYVTPGAEDVTTIRTRTVQVQKTKTVTATVTGKAALTIRRTIFVGSQPTTTLTATYPYETITRSKTVYVVAYPTKQDPVTVSTRLPQNTAASTVTKTVREGNNIRTVYVVYIGGRPVRTDIPTTTVYKTIGGSRKNIQIIYIVKDGVTKSITKTLNPDVMVKTITKGGKVVTTVTTVTATRPAPSDEPEESEDPEDPEDPNVSGKPKDEEPEESEEPEEPEDTDNMYDK